MKLLRILGLPVVILAFAGGNMAAQSSTITASYSASGVISGELDTMYGTTCYGAPGYANATIGGFSFTALNYGITQDSSAFDFSSTDISGGSTFGPGTYGVSAAFPGFEGTVNPDGGGGDCIVGQSSASTTVTIPAPVSVPATLTLSPSPAHEGQSVTITANVGGFLAGPYPTGTVSLLYGSDVIASSKLKNGTSGVTSTVTFTVPTSGITPGTYQLGILYGGDANYNSVGASASLTITAPRAATTTTLVISGSSVVGSNVTLSATVKPNTSGTTPTGTVTFYYGSLNLGSATLNSSGTGALTLSSTGIPPGTYDLKAAYGGDTNNSPSTSSTVALVLQASTTTTLSASPTTVTPGQKISMTATVKRLSSSGSPSGTVSYSLDSVVIGSSAVNAQGISTLSYSTTGIPAGTYTLTATFGGTALDLTSTSSPVTITVQ